MLPAVLLSIWLTFRDSRGWWKGSVCSQRCRRRLGSREKERGKDRVIERKWESRASWTAITLRSLLMTHAPISDWVDYGDSSLCWSESSLCTTFLWWRHWEGKNSLCCLLWEQCLCVSMPLLCLTMEEGFLFIRKKDLLLKISNEGLEFIF